MLPGEAGEVMERNSFGNIPVEQRDDLLKWKLRQDVRPPTLPPPPLVCLTPPPRTRTNTHTHTDTHNKSTSHTTQH